MIDVVCGLIENSNGEYLVCLRPLGKHLGGLWEFPGGKIDPGESPQTALARELQEELAIKVLVGNPLAPVTWNYSSGQIRLLPFLCVIIAGNPEPLEHAQLLWCLPENFPQLDWAAADMPIIEELLRLKG